ncbi:MAG: dinitrogenase iron-molybdenum cofactor biosynthesis protein [Candidatus Latescibacteria bacterium]|nr:dinitrogenase iron-molybdenum cofactor biosynthesis protein [bacterium]MBD3424143.1 dinitrogenase iron-molybdenum cofactor biosynthesis protein [Candidatus Latescibacterota bacterium]
MKILFTSRGDSWDSEIDPRFGRTEFFFIYDDDSEEVQTYDNRDIANQAHGAGPRTAQKMADYKVDVMVTGNGPGGNAAAVIEKMGVKVYAGAGGMTVKEAYQSFRDGELSEF